MRKDVKVVKVWFPSLLVLFGAIGTMVTIMLFSNYLPSNVEGLLIK